MFLPPVLKPVAAGLAALYELGVRARLFSYARGWQTTRKLPAPVISVGNLTVGGTGKTPCTAYLALMLRAAGYQVAVLSRGYKRQSQGLVEVSDGARVLCSAADAGDEPFLLAQQCPGVRVVVNADRYAAGMWLWQRARVDVFLLDDGYQHIQLHRDLNLALVDAREDLAKARMLPAGHWREPLASWRRADAVIVTRANDAQDFESLQRQLKKYLRAEVPVYAATHQLTGLRALPTDQRLALSDFARQSVSVMSAIAQPERLYADLQQQNLQLITRHAFADHHRFMMAEVNEVLATARQAGAMALFVTEKDAANLPAELWATPLLLPLYAVQLGFCCHQAGALREIVMASL